jgi:hypothetical protein
MFKKTMLLAMAVGAIAAFVAPTVASAQLLTDPEGVALAKNSEITATSTNLVTTTGLGDLTCGKVTIHLKVTKNTGATSAAESTSVTTENCDLLTTPSLAVDPATITSATTKFHIEKAGVGTTTATFIAHLYANEAKHLANEPFAICHESGTPGITYGADTDVIHVSGALTGPCGNASIAGDFTIETANGTRVTID